MSSASSASAARAGLSALLDLLLPATCGGCGAAGSSWCPRCARRLPRPRTVRVPGLPAVVVAGQYAGPLRAALLGYKERGRRDLGPPLAALLGVAVAGASAGASVGAAAGAETSALAGAAAAAAGPAGGALLVPVPSRPAAARARGGNHMRRLCRRVPGVVVAPVLRLERGTRDSVGLDAAAREANLRGRVRFDPRAWARCTLPTGLAGPAPVIVVDDVVTTGATLRACAGALRDAGIPLAGAAVLCDATGRSRGP